MYFHTEIYKYIHVFIYPFESQRRIFCTFNQNFDFKIRRVHQKNFLCIDTIDIY